jgi:hypothetical protein
MAQTKLTKGFGPFQPAENLHGYAKVGIYGFQGSGKTYSASEMARGLWQRLIELKTPDAGKPVAFIDSEKGSDFMAKRFTRWGIPFVNTRTKSFTDLMAAMESTVGNASIVIVDSITLFWAEMQKAYKRAKIINNLERRGFTKVQIDDALKSNKYTARLTFSDWMPLKDEWRRFVDFYVNQPIHIIICGRAKWEYDFAEDDNGQKQIEKTGSSMKVDSELSFEPSLLIEMRHEPLPAADGRVDALFWQHVAYVLKDRADLIDGQRFVNPVYDHVKPHFEEILGRGFATVTDGTKDSALFVRSGQSIEQTREQAVILCEEIMGELLAVFPSTGADDKKAKADIIFAAFHTRSWTAVERMTIDQLKAGLDFIRGVCQKFITDNISQQNGKSEPIAVPVASSAPEKKAPKGGKK